MARKMTTRSAKKPTGTTRIARAAAKASPQKYVLRLYVTGMTPRSLRAIENLESICREYLSERYELEIIDIYQRPQLLRGEQIVATPTLIKKLPSPMRHLVGDLSNTEQVLFGLDLRPNRRKEAYE